jgi:hypothetical protein
MEPTQTAPNEQPLPDAQQALAKYEEMVAALDVLKMEHIQARGAVIPVDVLIELEGVDAEYDYRIKNADWL